MTLDWKTLLDPKGPLFRFVACDESAIDDFARTMPKDSSAVVRIVRGKRCTERTRLFQEWAAALQFPAYFGENWDAFEECLSDLEWLSPGGLILFITQSDRLLQKTPTDLRTVGDILKSAAREWKKSQPDRPYHIVLHAEPAVEANARERLAAAGLTTNQRG